MAANIINTLIMDQEEIHIDSEHKIKTLILSGIDRFPRKSAEEPELREC